MSEKNDDIKHDVTSINQDTSNASQDNLKSSDSSFESKTFNVESDSGLLPAELSKAGLEAVSSLSGSMAILSQLSDPAIQAKQESLKVEPNTDTSDRDTSKKEELTMVDPTKSNNELNGLEAATSANPELVSHTLGLEVKPETFVNTSQVIGVASHEGELIPASLISSAIDQDFVNEEEKLIASLTTAGALLKKAREEANVSELSLAAQLKVSVKTLRALEADELHLLPGVAFARSLVTSICRTIKVDATEILALMPKLPQAKSEASQPKGLNLPMSGSSIDVADTFAGVGIRVFIALIAIGLAIILVVNWSSASSSISNLSSSAASADNSSTISTEVTSNSSSIVPGSVASANTLVASVANSSTTTPATTTASSVVGNVASIAVPTPAPVVKPVASVAVTVAAPLKPASSAILITKPANVATISASAPVAQPGQAVIVFKLTETSYLEVSEAGNKQLLGKNAVKDDEVTVVAKMPVKVKVGNAASTTVVVNGQIYNTAPYSKGNVARFELK
jgi:cytoskeleton protein RodZ